MVINKKGFLCGLLLALFIMFGLSLNVSLDTSALKHEYLGIPYFSPEVPANFSSDFDCSSGRCIKPSGGFIDNHNYYGRFMPSFNMKFEGDSYNSSYDNLSLRYSSSVLEFNSSGNYSNIHATFNNRFRDGTPNTVVRPGNGWNTYYDTTIYNSSSLDSFQLARQRRPISNFFHSSSLPAGILSCEPFGYYINSSEYGGNGAVCGGLWNTSEYISAKVLPYWYSSDGFYLKSSTIDTDSGIHYDNTFSFIDLFNSYIPTFSYLEIPLFDYDGYFWDYDELYQGREIEFGGSFEFDGSFEWHSDINNNGSFFNIHYFGLTDLQRFDDSRYMVEDIGDIQCTTNLITLEGLTRLDYSCPWTLLHNYNYIGFSLQISGNGNYVWKTNKPWRFASTFLITDHDDSHGRPFNSILSGGGEIPGDAHNSIGSGTPDWFSSLGSLFTFGFLNPFAPIFNLFADQSSCASIPTLAGMLGSNETTVCPWFSSSTRAIVTPVLGLSSMMLVFGFAVRWLGSSSGNLFEDSGGHDTENFHVSSRFRRKK